MLDAPSMQARYSSIASSSSGLRGWLEQAEIEEIRMMNRIGRSKFMGLLVFLLGDFSLS